MSESTTTIDGMVIYTDGSFRRGHAGWGMHAYTYTKTPMTKGIGIKQLPTTSGYEKVALPDTVTPLMYLDAWGWIEETPTNNVAELQAMIEAYKYLVEHPVPKVLILSDSQYVKNGLQKWVKNWKRNNWIKPDGEPVANRRLWETFLEWEEKVKTLDMKIKVDWVKGHSGNVGNDIVDHNAKTGSGGRKRYHLKTSDPQGYHNPKVTSNDLMLKKWLVFDMADSTQHTDGFHYYHMFNLGGMNGYGHKKEDTLRQRHSKTATLFGRRIADATFCVMRTEEPVEDLDRIITLHQQCHQQDIVELGLACLDVLYKPAVQQRLATHGADSLIKVESNKSLITASDELVSITINPPYMANEGATMFGIIQRRFMDFLAGKSKKGIYTTDITAALYDETIKGDVTKKKLKPEIKQTTTHLNLPVRAGSADLTLKALLGIDLPQRNTLNRLADHNPIVHVLLIANGPECYSFSFVFQTAIGDVIYQSPYTQLLTPTSVTIDE